jgi:hypothetical protein
MRSLSMCCLTRLAVVACGGGESAETVTVTNAAPTTSGETTAPSETTASDEATAPDEEAGDFLQRVLEYRLLEQFGREYEALHPAHQALISRTDFEACWRALGGSGFPPGTTLESFRVIDEYEDPYASVGIAVTREGVRGGRQPVAFPSGPGSPSTRAGNPDGATGRLRVGLSGHSDER